jgi:hypothetical protein
MPDFGSGQSSSKFVLISHELLVPSLAERVACHATKDPYFILLVDDRIDENGGTNLIFVPSGKIFAEDPYQVDNWFRRSCTLSTALSRCIARTNSVGSTGSFFLL